jgi:hypothetical protein
MPDEWLRGVFMTYGGFMIVAGMLIGIGIHRIWLDLRNKHEAQLAEARRA